MSPSLPPAVSRWGPWLALVGAVAVAAAVQSSRLRPDLAPVTPPPAQPAALDAWLAQRAPAVDTPALAPDAWPDLAGAPDLAWWARSRVDLAVAPPAVARGLAVHAVPVRILRRLAPAAGLDVEAVGVLLDPAAARRVAEACPRLDAALRGALCRGGGPDTRRLDAAVGDVLASDDLEQGLWGVELAIRLGDRGRALAEARTESAVGVRGRVLVVLAWTLSPPEAESRLRAHLDPADPLAPLAALELARLGAGGDALADLETRAERPADAALVAFARAVAERRAPPESAPVGLVGAGL